MILVSLTIGATLLASSVPAIAEDKADEVPMSLSECLTTALENNLDLAIAKKDPEIADLNVTFQKAAFDPTLGAGLTHQANRLQQAQVFDFVVPPRETQTESRVITDTIDASLRQTLNFGANYEVTASALTTPGFSGSQIFSDADPTLLISEAEFERAKSWQYGVRFTLPFLRGFGRPVNEASLLVATHNLNISQNELQRLAELAVKSAGDAYWDLLAAREAEKVAIQALELSQELYELNKKKVEVGTLAPIEITQAEANVASNVEGTIRTKQAVENAEDNLLRLLAVPESDPLWTKTILPTEKAISEPTVTDQEAAIKTAYERRPEIATARQQIEISNVEQTAAHNGVKHQLDLVATWARSHSEQPENVTVTNVDPLVDGVYSFDPVTRRSPDWSVALLYSYPIGNRAAKSNYAISKINAEKSQIALESVMQDVRVDVRRSARAVEAGYERVVAARKNTELQTKKLEAEQKKFDNGMSTSFEVFTFQTDLRNAQLALIQALLDYNKALADLERAKGTLLESNGLKLAANQGN
jgi:outer membrane protein TolC